MVSGNPDYGLRLSWNFLSRSTSGLLDWAERLGDGVEWDRRTLSNMRMGRLLSQAILRSARAHEAADQRRVGSIFRIVDVVLAPTTAQPPPLAHAFDRLSGLGTDRAMIAACPVTWPWNVLGWPSINVPAGFTSDGLPIGVQLMGPANSEPHADLAGRRAGGARRLGGQTTRGVVEQRRPTHRRVTASLRRTR